MKRSIATTALEIGASVGRLAVVLLAGCGVREVSAGEIERIAAVLELDQGVHVADVGAGDGEWAIEMAGYVGSLGHVWATEVDAADVEAIERRIDRRQLSNVTAVLGDQTGSGLPDACCDAILLRLVYHHFEDPRAMRQSLARALKHDGRIAVIDIIPQESWRELPDVPDRGGHGIPPEDLVREMTADGFEVVTRQDRWNGDDDRFCIVFRRSD